MSLIIPDITSLSPILNILFLNVGTRSEILQKIKDQLSSARIKINAIHVAEPNTEKLLERIFQTKPESSTKAAIVEAKAKAEALSRAAEKAKAKATAKADAALKRCKG